MKKSLSKYLFIAGVLVFIISYLLPVDFFVEFINLIPTGLTSLSILRVIGIIGLVFAVKEKSVCLEY